MRVENSLLMVFIVQDTYTCSIFLKIQKKKLKIARPDSLQNFMDKTIDLTRLCIQITITAVLSNHTNL